MAIEIVRLRGIIGGFLSPLASSSTILVPEHPEHLIDVKRKATASEYPPRHSAFQAKGTVY